MNPGISIRFDTQETHKSPPHLWGQRRGFYLLPKDLEQSGEVTALTTTNAIKRPSADFSRSSSGLKYRGSTEFSFPLNAVKLLLPAWCFHPEQIWAGGGPQECGPFAVELLANAPARRLV
jgi:hypothetical protein